jgi:imidazolonepropionase-like amidohydrolase
MEKEKEIDGEISTISGIVGSSGPAIKVGTSVRETRLAFEREKLTRQESLKEERKLKSDRVQKEIAELRTIKASQSPSGTSPSSASLQPNLEKKSLVGHSPAPAPHTGKSSHPSLEQTHEKKSKGIKLEPMKSSASASPPPGIPLTPVPVIVSSVEKKEEIQEELSKPSSSLELHQDDPEQFPLLILENCQIVDVTLGEISANHHVIISLDGKILSMGPAPFIPAVKSWMRYDCQEMFLLPGLCDAHTNITVPFDPSPSLPRSSASYLALSSSHILKSLLHSGFTTIRDCGGVDIGILQAISENLLDAPRILSSGMALGPRGAFQDSSRYDPSLPSTSVSSCPHSIYCTRKCSSWCGWSVTQGEPQLRDFIQTLFQYHSISQLSLVCGNHCVDMNALLSSSSLSRLNQKEYPLFSNKEYETIAEECSVLSLPIMATCNTVTAIERALAIGCSSLDGGLHLTTDLAQKMKEMECYLTPLLPSSLLNALVSHIPNQLAPQKRPPSSSQTPTTSRPFSPESQQPEEDIIEEAFQKLFGQILPTPTQLHYDEFKQWSALLSLATEADLAMVYGSNLHSNQYHRLTHPLLSLHASHLSPIQFLQSLTCNAAKLFRIEDVTGTISVGAVADLILIPINPLLEKKWCETEDSICAVIQVRKLSPSLSLRPYLSLLYLSTVHWFCFVERANQETGSRSP